MTDSAGQPKQATSARWALTINVKEVVVPTEIPISVYEVELFDDHQTWFETFATMDHLLAFLRGIKVAYSMMPCGKLLPDFGDEALVKFDPKSCIDKLP